MRFQCIAMGSYLVKTGRKTTLMLSAKQNGDSFLLGLFGKVSNLLPSLRISSGYRGEKRKFQNQRKLLFRCQVLHRYCDTWHQFLK